MVAMSDLTEVTGSFKEPLSLRVPKLRDAETLGDGLDDQGQNLQEAETLKNSGNKGLRKG